MHSAGKEKVIQYYKATIRIQQSQHLRYLIFLAVKMQAEKNMNPDVCKQEHFVVVRHVEHLEQNTVCDD